MKGRHISKAMQRRMRQPKPYYRMSLFELSNLRDKWYDLEYRHGHSKVIRMYPKVYAEGKAAQTEIRTRFPFG